MENTLAALEARQMQLGEGFTNYWFAAAAYCLALAKVVPQAEVDRKKLQVIDNICKSHYKEVALQDPEVKAEILEREKTKVTLSYS